MKNFVCNFLGNMRFIQIFKTTAQQHLLMFRHLAQREKLPMWEGAKNQKKLGAEVI